MLGGYSWPMQVPFAIPQNFDPCDHLVPYCLAAFSRALYRIVLHVTLGLESLSNQWDCVDNGP